MQWTWGDAHEVIIWAVIFGPGLDPGIGEWIEIGRSTVDIPPDKLRFAEYAASVSELEARNLDGTNHWTPHDDPRGIGHA